MILFKFRASDGENLMDITIFNSKYQAEKIEIGKEYLFYGKVDKKGRLYEMSAPEIECAANNERIRPVYSQTAGLSTKIIEKTLAQILNDKEFAITDILPQAVREKYNLCSIKYALKNIHFPQSDDVLKTARKRLVFDELFIFQIAMKKLRHRVKQDTSAVIKQNYSSEFFNMLPFKPTNAQIRAVNDCINDMSRPNPMSRLLQGDVGSGKTAVAAAICYNAAKNGFQSALMAPTEILAIQHYDSLSQLLTPSGIKTALLTGSTTAAEKKNIRQGLADGSIQFVVGTHALLQENVIFKALGLVVTDEQHRFGVSQRACLAGKGINPHLLVMSATPIPRTLALIIYGDLDISVLDEMPPGRQVIETYRIDSGKRERAYNFIKKHLDTGRQAYIVCPLVEQNQSELTAATVYADEISQKYFINYNVGLLYGKMKPSQKESVMKDFAEGKIQLLVSTTVIEVGIDVPNAVIMLIENAERFGLSQLHQLRGRVGRGKYKSYCILVSDAKGDIAKKRLNVMCATNNGFIIADEDLKLRGPGDFFGNRQHGLPNLNIADLHGDMDILKLAQDAAAKLLENDPDLMNNDNRFIKAETEKLFEDIGEYGLN